MSRFHREWKGFRGTSFALGKEAEENRKRTKYGEGMNEEGNRDEEQMEEKSKNLKGREGGGTLEMPSS